MTCKELFKIRHPDACVYDAVVEFCPKSYGIMEDPDWCFIGDHATCARCWDREVPESGHDDPPGEPGVPGVPIEPTILDSGDRTEFASGARRDMRAGKGRFDISPLEVISKMIDPDGDTILDCIADFMREGDTRHLYDALNTFTAVFHNQMETLLLETAVHFEEGAKKYGEANFRLGIPIWCYIDSAVRHYIKWLRGDREERHDRAFCWNLMCGIWEVDHGDAWRKAQASKTNVKEDSNVQ